MKVGHWILNALLAAASIACFALILKVNSAGQQIGLGLTGAAFAVACFLFVRHTINK